MSPRPRSGGNGRPVEAPACSVIIRVYNEEQHIGRLLAGILNETVLPAEIILVDSGSTDATLAVASRYPVRLLHIDPADFTFGRSLNLGCAAARGEFIVIASGHVYPVYPDWLERLLQPFREARTGLVYGKQHGEDATRFSEHQVFRQWFPDQSMAQQTTAFCNNANAAIRRSLWQRRPYNEDLPGLEDIDWATWALAEGYRIAYQAEAEVVHVHDESPRAVFNRYRREAMALKRIRPQEHFGLLDLVRLFAVHVSLDFTQALQQGVAHRKLAEILWFRWMQFWGTYRGFSTTGPLTGQLKETFYYPRRSAPISAPTRALAPLDYAVLAPRQAAPPVRPVRARRR